MKMKKFINNPENLTPELLEGFAEAHKELVTLGENRMIINNKLAEADRVTIVTQGGSGHEPAISGFVGEGMVDISVVGDVFAAPVAFLCLRDVRDIRHKLVHAYPAKDLCPFSRISTAPLLERLRR